MTVPVESRFSRAFAVDEADIGREDGGDADGEGDPAGAGGCLGGDGERRGGEAAQPEE